MLDKLEQIVQRYEELTQELSSPELLTNPSAYGKVAKQHRTLGEVVQKFQAWKGLKTQLADARELLGALVESFSRPAEGGECNA